MTGNADRAEEIAVVVGSNRPTRICGAIAEWSVEHLAADSPLSYQLVDLAVVDLPFLDEPLMPALGNYQRVHTKAWSRQVSSFAGFVFVFPQYNWGYPAVLKNALDFLYEEWADKPAGLVTYGTRGGGRGAAQLLQVLQGLHMQPLDGNVELKIGPGDVDDAGQLLDPSALLAPYGDSFAALDAQMREVLSAR